jgi:hypothetical protein
MLDTMAEFARKLERERDEALNAIYNYKCEVEAWEILNKVKRERDEAREMAQQMSESNQVLMADVHFYRNAWEQLKEGAK